MSKGATVSVLYPRTATSTFNLDYYLSTHMALVSKTWKDKGMKSWSVTQFGEGSPYSTHCLMEWESLEAFGKAAAEDDTKAVMADIENFSNEKPILIQGSVVGRS
ncbi:hypothetical protein K469DRAFT_569436 [Zopfia rhizophila CBS 207.26]|uniref:EthD domain-containing protein n=1 Tax=Zopfia rhizophila CBS 207.26 TaxID=1314779 RepID=A0A6A6E985_9PEZI|nr:hypothetical protein K469DRAFT_569436 [Zopfia rhizophila CBS 207.26]